jgi:hypothetical protein
LGQGRASKKDQGNKQHASRRKFRFHVTTSKVRGFSYRSARKKQSSDVYGMSEKGEHITSF